ncbi:MAG: DUF177 domain-containing protein [Bacteroidetes bacterium]|nr:DUF177 domain-containing protein [Bacteroidota bacterium]
MKRREKFVINFGSLSKGIHEFVFEVDDSFFEHFENSIAQQAHADVLVTLEKKDDLLLVDFTIEGIAKLPCDRCLEELEIPLEGYNELMVKFGEKEEEESEDVIVLPAKAHELDVSQFIYEYITMLIPLRNIHLEDDDGNSTCNPEAIKNLEKYRIHEEEIKPTDPRWEALKKINPN